MHLAKQIQHITCAKLILTPDSLAPPCCYFSHLFKRKVYNKAGAYSAQTWHITFKSTPCAIQTLLVSPVQPQGRVSLSTAISCWQERGCLPQAQANKRLRVFTNRASHPLGTCNLCKAQYKRHNTEPSSQFWQVVKPLFQKLWKSCLYETVGFSPR